MYHPNLLCNDEYIQNYQNIHRDFDFGKPKMVLKKKPIKNLRKMCFRLKDTLLYILVNIEILNIKYYITFYALDFFSIIY